MKRKPLTTEPAYGDGVKARASGADRIDNPYDMRTRSGKAWDAGYMRDALCDPIRVQRAE